MSLCSQLPQSLFFSPSVKSDLSPPTNTSQSVVKKWEVPSEIKLTRVKERSGIKIPPKVQELMDDIAATGNAVYIGGSYPRKGLPNSAKQKAKKIPKSSPEYDFDIDLNASAIPEDLLWVLLSILFLS